MSTRGAQLARPRVRLRGRRPPRAIVLAVVSLVALYFVVPHVAGLEHTWQRIHNGSPAWLAAAGALEVGSFVGYVWLLRRIAAPLRWADAWRITLAGVAATRIVTVAGAGGIAVTVTGLRRAGRSTREAPKGRRWIRRAVRCSSADVVDASRSPRRGAHPGLTVVRPSSRDGDRARARVVSCRRLSSVSCDAASARCGRRRRPAGSDAGGVRGAIELVALRDRALTGALVWWAFDSRRCGRACARSAARSGWQSF